MAYTSQIRIWWKDFFKQGYDRHITLLSRPGVKAADFTLDAWLALGTALTNSGYGVASIVSTYYPRYISGTTLWSLHSYSGVALDIDPALNPFVKNTSWDFSRCKFTREQVDAVLAIRTKNGYRVWRWGGDFGDYMHWQLDCRPSDIATGIDWDTVLGDDGSLPEEGDDMGLKNGDQGAAVGQYQRALMQWNSDALPMWGDDEDFGDETEQWTRIFQADNDLIETGQVDTSTVFCIGPYAVGSALSSPSGIVALEAAIVEVDRDLDVLDGKVSSVLNTLRSV